MNATAEATVIAAALTDMDLHLDEAIRLSGELAALLDAVQEVVPSKLVKLAAELAARLDAEVEAAVLAKMVPQH